MGPFSGGLTTIWRERSAMILTAQQAPSVVKALTVMSLSPTQGTWESLEDWGVGKRWHSN
jgi:hypothetical protein